MTDNLGGGQLHVYIEDGNPIGDDCIWWGGLLVDINTATFAEKNAQRHCMTCLMVGLMNSMQCGVSTASGRDD